MKIGLPAVISFRGSSSPAESSRYAMESAPLNPRDSEEDTKALDQTFHDNVAPGHPNKVVDQIAQIAPIASEAVVYRVYKRRWFGLVMLIIMNIVVSWGWLTFAPVANLTVAWFNLKSDSPVNWLSTVILFAYIVATPAVIYLLGRFSIKPALLLASFLLLAGNWIRYAGTKTQSFNVTMFGQIVIGLSQPFVLSAPPHYSDLWFTSKGRVSATAIASLSNPIGAALGQLVNPMLATKPSDLPQMVLYIAIIATVSVLGWVFFPAHPPSPPCASAQTPKSSFKETLNILKSSRDFWIIWTMFTVYLALFNAFSTLLNQIMLPRGYSADNAGLTGALLIVAGLVCSAIVSPIIDRTRSYFITLRICIPLIAVSYIAFIFAPNKGAIAAPFVVAAILGATSFCLLPMALELCVEYTYPVAPEWTSSLLWCGGQLFGAVAILVMDALKTKDGDMKWALVFQAAVAVIVAPGAFMAKRKNVLKRLEADGSV